MTPYPTVNLVFSFFLSVPQSVSMTLSALWLSSMTSLTYFSPPQRCFRHLCLACSKLDLIREYIDIEINTTVFIGVFFLFVRTVVVFGVVAGSFRVCIALFDVVVVFDIEMVAVLEVTNIVNVMDAMVVVVVVDVIAIDMSVVVDVFVFVSIVFDRHYSRRTCL